MHSRDARCASRRRAARRPASATLTGAEPTPTPTGAEHAGVRRSRHATAEPPTVAHRRRCPPDCRRTPPAASVRRSDGGARFARGGRRSTSRRARAARSTRRRRIPCRAKAIRTPDLMCVGEAPGATEDETGTAVRRRGGTAAHKNSRGDRSARARTSSSATSSSIVRRATAIRCRKRLRRAVRTSFGRSS